MRKWFSIRAAVMIGGLAAAAAAAVVGLGQSSTTALADTTGCPSVNGKLGTNLVGASYSGSNTVTYVFTSFSDLSPSSGVPGLIKYCVYPASTPDAGSITISAVGDNGAALEGGLVLV